VRAAGALEVHALRGVPEVRPGDDLAALILAAVGGSGLDLRPWDVVVVTHKVVSKAEGALVDLGTITPSAAAIDLAGQTGGDPRVVEVALRESRRVLRVGLGVLVCETNSGLVCANAGVAATSPTPTASPCCPAIPTPRRPRFAPPGSRRPAAARSG